MYTPQRYRNDDAKSIDRFIRNNGFGMIITTSQNGPVATHLPLELHDDDDDGKKYLTGHFSRANPQWQTFSDNVPVLAIFHGPHAYISPSWSKEPNVPTWNYMAVHVQGIARCVSDDELQKILSRLVERYEHYSPYPMHLDTLPKEFLERKKKGVIGFKIEIQNIEATWKLSQNRTKDDYQNIIRQLDRINMDNSRAIAAEMRRIRSK